MHFQIISKSEIDEVVKLRSYCFEPVHANATDEDMLPWLEQGAIIGGYDGKQLATQLVVFPFVSNVFGVEMKMGGIGWVSTYPEYRSGGHTSQLMRESLAKMRADGQVLSTLAPFSESFYRKFGWDVYFENTEYRIPSDSLTLRESESGRVVRFNYTEKSEWFEKVKTFHNEVVRTLNGQIFRDNDWWQRLEDRAPEDHFVVSLDADGLIEGYMRYNTKDETFRIKDFYSINVHSDRVLWGYVRSHSSQVEEVVGTMPAHSSFPVIFKEPNVERKVYFDKMIRIVDVEAFLKLYPFVELEETLYVKVNDSQAEWNDAFFQIGLDGSVEKVLDAPGDKVLEMDIGAFSTLMVGFHGIDWYERNGQAKVAPLLVPVWRKALAAGYPSINENF